MSEKRYYWLKLKEDYFNSPKIKKLRKIAGGDTYTIIYLKMQLLSISNNGIIEFEGIEPTFQEELALKLDEDVENVNATLIYIQSQGLIEESDNKFLLLEASDCIGSECDSAERVRQFREKKKQIPEANKEPKSNAIRQRQYRAKEICKGVQHIPLIDDYTNNKRYNGNYYVVLKRDKMKCAICGSIENLCVHHIDGYNELKPENSNENKMITLCRNCHSNVHSRSLELSQSLLDSIDYYYNSNENNEICNGCVTDVKQISISSSISNSIYNSNKEDESVREEETKKQKHKYGEYKHILLTDEELEKLNTEFGEEETQKAITYLDEYIEMKGAKYKSHYMAMRKWVFSAVKEKEQKTAKENKANKGSMWDTLNEAFNE